jgi:hypothetical protein
MPTEPIRKPTDQNTAAANIAARGPFLSTQVPNSAAETPSMTIAIEKMMPIAVSVVSKCLTSAVLYTLVAYAWPMHRWTARAAGGISQRLKPGRATMRSRARKLGTATEQPPSREGRARSGATRSHAVICAATGRTVRRLRRARAFNTRTRRWRDQPFRRSEARPADPADRA